MGHKSDVRAERYRMGWCSGSGDRPANCKNPATKAKCPGVIVMTVGTKRHAKGETVFCMCDCHAEAFPDRPKTAWVVGRNEQIETDEDGAQMDAKTLVAVDTGNHTTPSQKDSGEPAS